MAQAEAFVYRLTLRKRGDSGAQVAGLRAVMRAWGNHLPVAPALPKFMKYLNAL